MSSHTVCATFVATIGATLALTSMTAMAGKPGGGTGTYNPKIAYTRTQGSTASVYLANADGSNPVAVYSRRSGGVGRVDFVPGSGPNGGRLVFGSTLGSISVLTYTVSASGVNTTDVTLLVPEGPMVFSIDVSANGEYVLYAVGRGDNTNSIKVISISGGEVTTIATGNFGSAVWSHDLTRIAVLDGFESGRSYLQQINMLTLNESFVLDSTKTRTVYTAPCLTCTTYDIEYARTSDSVIFSASTMTDSTREMFVVDASGPTPSAVTSYGVGFLIPCFNADDSRILYRNFSDSLLYVFNPSDLSRTKVTSVGVNSSDFMPKVP